MQLEFQKSTICIRKSPNTLRKQNQQELNNPFVELLYELFLRKSSIEITNFQKRIFCSPFLNNRALGGGWPIVVLPTVHAGKAWKMMNV